MASRPMNMRQMLGSSHSCCHPKIPKCSSTFQIIGPKGGGGGKPIPEKQVCGNLWMKTQETFSEILGITFLRDV